MADQRRPAGRSGIRRRARRQRPARLAGPQAGLRPAGGFDRPAHHRGRPRRARGRGERRAPRAREPGIQGRVALAHGTDQRGRLLHGRRPALSLSRLRQPPRRGQRRQGPAHGRSDRPAADRRCRRLDPDRGRRAALRGWRAIGASGGAGARRRLGAHHRAVARQQPPAGRRPRGGARADRAPVRPRRAGDQAQGQCQPDIRRPAGDHRRTVVAADRSRPRAGAAGRVARPAAGRDAHAGRILRRHAAAADSDDAEHRGRDRHPGRGDAIAIDRLKLELDRMTVAGRFAYAFPSQDRPARLDAALTAPEIDLDRVQALAKALLGGAALDWPREGALSLKIGRAVVAGVEAKQADVEMRVDAAGLAIERLAVADFGGAALAVKGRIDSKERGPRGALSLDLDARALDGITALIEAFAPQVADRLRRAAPRLVPLTLRAALAVEPDAAGTAAKATFKTDGRAGAFRLAVQGDAGAESEAFKLEKLAALAAAKVNLTGRLDADDGRALSELIGLDSYVAVDKRPGQLTLTAKGSLESDIAIEGKLVAGALDASANGAVRLPARGNPDARLSAGLNLKVNNANVLSPRPASAGRPTELLPTSVSAGLDLSDGTLSLSLAGTVAGTSVNGRLAVGIEQQPVTVDGDLELGSVDLPAAIATALGMPAQKTGSGPVEPWPADPFDKAARPIKGQITFKSARVAVTPKLAATELRGVVRFGEPRLSLQVIEGSLAGGRVAGELIFLPPGEGEGLLARGRVRLAGVNAEELLPGDGSISGRLTLDASAEGTGMSAVALVGSLAGKGSFTLENGKLARLDPTAFETVIRAVDQGLPIDAARVKDKTEAALA